MTRDDHIRRGAELLERAMQNIERAQREPPGGGRLMLLLQAFADSAASLEVLEMLEPPRGPTHDEAWRIHENLRGGLQELLGVPAVARGRPVLTVLPGGKRNPRRRRNAGERLVAQPFELAGRPVRIVAYDWRGDKEYSDADAQGILEVYQVTWSDSDDIERGWVADIQQRDDGSWTSGDNEEVAYATAESAALQAVLDWMAYEKTLTDEDLEKLAAKIIPVIAAPGTKPPPTENPRAKLKRRLMR